MKLLSDKQTAPCFKNAKKQEHLEIADLCQGQLLRNAVGLSSALQGVELTYLMWQ